jgi:hypothetical protein
LLAIRLCNKIKSPVFSTHRKMPANTNAREKLDGAIAQERQEQRDARQMYEELTARMWAYQTGNGPAPTNEDFERWSFAVEQRVKMKHLGIRVDGEPEP